MAEVNYLTANIHTCPLFKYAIGVLVNHQDTVLSPKKYRNSLIPIVYEKKLGRDINITIAE